MKKYFCCFKKKKAVIGSYVEYYSNNDNFSESSITNSLIDAINENDENEYDRDNIIYHCNPLNKDCASVVGGRNPQGKKN